MDYFSNFGNQMSVEFKTDYQTHKNRGFGFLVFNTAQLAKAVLKAGSIHYIGSSKIWVFGSKSSESMTRKAINRLETGYPNTQNKRAASNKGPVSNAYPGSSRVSLLDNCIKPTSKYWKHDSVYSRHQGHSLLQFK